MSFWTVKICNEWGDERGAFVWHDESEQFVSCDDSSKAHRFTSQSEAERLADDFSDYWAIKGYGKRAYAEEVK